MNNKKKQATFKKLKTIKNIFKELYDTQLMKNPAIEFSNVSLNYNQIDKLVEVLKNIRFSIKADEIVSIVGPSGSGKTSIIMLTAGLEKYLMELLVFIIVLSIT